MRGNKQSRKIEKVIDLAKEPRFRSSNIGHQDNS